MRRIVRKAEEMKRPGYRFCPSCDGKVRWEEKICPDCRRLMVRNLRAAGKTELLENGGESYFCQQEKRRRNRILFEQMAEEPETDFATETRI